MFKFFIIFLIYFVINIFILSNILLPLFYAIPKLLREKISIIKPILSVIVNTIILFLFYLVVINFFETTKKLFTINVIFSGFYLILFSKKRDIEYDIQKTYLHKHNELKKDKDTNLRENKNTQNQNQDQVNIINPMGREIKQDNKEM